MKAVFRYGQEKGSIEIRDMPIPEIGDGDVLMKVKSAGLCGSDINSYMGRTHLHLPVIMGHEFAGEVAAVGRRVTVWKPGDRVCSDNTGYLCGACPACRRGDFYQCSTRKGLGSKMNGGFAEYVRIPEEALAVNPNSLVRIPDSISDDEAAIIDPPSNAYNALIQQGGLQVGDTVAVLGAGPLSLSAITMANASGAVGIVCIVRRSTNDLHRDAAKKLGATHIFEEEDPDLIEKIMELTRGEGVAMTVDGAGPNHLFKKSVDMTMWGGKIVRIAYDWGPLNYSLNDFVNHNITLVGHMGYTPTAWLKAMKLLDAGKIDVKTMITHRMPLTDFFKGVDAMMSREAIKVIFKPEW